MYNLAMSIASSLVETTILVRMVLLTTLLLKNG